MSITTISPRRALTRALTGLASGVIALATLGLGTAPAHADEAAPTLHAYGHTDAPKAFWEEDSSAFGGHITLKSKNSALASLDSTIHWLHRDPAQPISRSGSAYVFTVPDIPAASFLGSVGDRLYWGSSNSEGPNYLWIGYGADAAIPVENFRDRSFQLEMTGFEGPGDMDIFGYMPVDEEDDTPVRHLLSSRTPGLQQAFMTAGTHTHLNTTFTKPGRYTLKYRTVYRDKATNAFVYSGEQTMIWQVGGPNPTEARFVDTASINDAYNASPDTGEAGFVPKFTISSTPEDARAASEPLTRFSFSTGNPADTGTAVFYIDGHYMAQAPVEGGRADWDEMIGSQNANFQVVYVPDEGAKSPRWYSAPVSATTGSSAETDELGTVFPQPAENTWRPGGEREAYDAASKNVTVTTQRQGTDIIFTVKPEDERIITRVRAVYGEDEIRLSPSTGDPTGEAIIEFISTPDHRSFTFKASFPIDSAEITKAVVELTPVAESNLGQTIIRLTADEEGDSTANGEFSGTVAEPAPQPEAPAPAPQPEAPAPAPDAPEMKPAPTPDGPGDEPNTPPETKPNGPTAADIRTDKVTLNDGHLDFGPIGLADGTLRMIVGDDSRLFATQSVMRDPGSVTIAASLKKNVRSPKVFGHSSYDFLGDEQDMYVLNQTQTPGQVWPGFSTERLDAAAFPNNATLAIRAHSVPEGAKAWAFTGDGLGLREILADSTKSETTIDGRTHAHIHANWVFTKPGTYVFEVSAAAERAGKQGVSTFAAETATASALYTFTIADKDAKDTTPKADPDGKGPLLPLPPLGKDDEKSAPGGSNGSGAAPGGSSGGGAAPGGSTGGGAAPGGSSGGVTECIPTKVENEISEAQAKAGTTQVGGSFTVPANTHVHPNWVFTLPGTYKVGITQTAKSKDGKDLSASGVLTFTVGGVGNANEGHFDIGSQVKDGALVMAVKDDRAQPASWVAPDTLNFGLSDASKAKAPAGMEFIAQEGQEIWMISSTQVGGVPWVGANTQDPSLISGTTGEVTWILTSVDGPGALAVFSSGNLGQVVGQKWFGGADKSGGNGLAPGVTERDGKYYLTTVVGKTKDGKDCDLNAAKPSDLAKTGSASEQALMLAGALGLVGAAVATRRKRA